MSLRGEWDFLYLLVTSPAFRASVEWMGDRLSEYARSEEGQQAIEEFTTACFVIELGEPEEEVFV